jgi:nucleoside 2-deoxyribosyltransferase
MADFNRKKLQVFVSSTFSDLIPERQAAVEAILTAGHIPAGMELFTAGDESQMEVIKQWIDESDVYLLILGGRYGSIEPKTGKSYTQLEYEYAIAKAKPLFACVIKNTAIELRVKEEGTRVIELDNQAKLKEFRAEVLTRTSKFWEDHKDIKITIAETLATFARREDLAGWVRSTTQSNLPALADEITRLSKENAQLRVQIANNTAEEMVCGLPFPDLRAVLDRKGLVDQLLMYAGQIAAQGAIIHDTPPLRELAMHGILQRERHGYGLTEGGRAFLNKLEALQLRRNTPTPSPK